MKRILPATEFVHSVIRSADDTRFHEVRRSRCLCPPPSFIFVRRNFQFLDNIVPGIVDARLASWKGEGLPFYRLRD